MRDTPAWPLSSGTALQIMQRCIGSRGPYGGGVFISAVVIGARESTPCFPLFFPLVVQHPITLSSSPHGARIYLSHFAASLPRQRIAMHNAPTALCA